MSSPIEDFFAGGELTLNPDLARESLAREISEPLGLELNTAAAGIHRIINARMADQLRLVSVRRGHDPRRFGLVPLGGAGPIHAGRLAEQLGIGQIIVPPAPGVLSAFGLLVADIEHEHSATFGQESSSVDLTAMRQLFAELDSFCRQKMELDRVPANETKITWSCETRYVGQAYELEVPLHDHRLSETTIERAVSGFHELHEEIYGHCNRNNRVEFVNLRSVHRYALRQPELRHALIGDLTLERAQVDERAVFFEELERPVATPIFRRELLPVGDMLRGPAIIEQADTTTIVYPDWELQADELGNLRMTHINSAAQLSDSMSRARSTGGDR